MKEVTKEYIKAVAILVIIVLVGFAINGIFLQKSNDTPAPTSKNTGEVQYATLTFENQEYQIEPSELEVGVPVEMTVDLESVRGCLRDVVIPEYGVRKYVREGDNIITFTPTKTGNLPIACSMNMGTGTLKVI